MNVLNISGIFPAPIDKKKSENDILLEIAHRHESIKSEVSHHFLLLIPYSNFLTSFFSSKWKEYRLLRKQGVYSVNKRTVYVIGVPAFRNDTFFKKVLNLVGYWLNREKLLGIVSELSINLIHAHNIDLDSGIASLLAKKADVPYVVTTRNLTKIPITAYIEKILARASGLISLSLKVQKVANQYNESSVLIPHGIGSEFLKESGHGEKLQIDTPRLVTVGRLLKLKNIDNVIRALAQIDRDFQYDIYGDGPEHSELESLIYSLSLQDKINLKGRIKNSELSELLPSYSVFIMVSYPETFGRVYIEAMGCRVPVIASKFSGIADYMVNEKHGFLVDHTDIEEIKHSIVKLLNKNTNANMSVSCYTLAKKFSWERIVENLHSVYKEALDKRRSILNK